MPQHVCRTIYALLLFLAFTLLLQPSAAEAQANTPPDSMRAAARQIAALRQEWVLDLHDKQLDAAMRLYTEDAVFFSPNGPRSNGLPAIRTLFATVMKNYDSDIQLTSTGLAVSGDLAYDSGDYDETLTVRATRAKMVIHGSYSMVLRRGHEERWRILQQMWTDSSPAK